MIQLLYNKKAIKESTKRLNNKTFVFNYSKFFIRNNFNNKDLILDNSFEISSGLSKIEFNGVGYSIILNKFLYKHKLDKNLKFYWFNPNVNLPQNVTTHAKFINVKHFIFFTKIIKGGIECYSNGLKGFLPKEHLIHVIKQLKNYSLKFKINNFITLNNKSKFFCLKIPINLTKLTVCPANTKTVYSKKNKSISNTNNKFNITFNYPKQSLNYENKKNTKKNRKYYYKKKN